jgi:hypothetical protein
MHLHLLQQHPLSSINHSAKYRPINRFPSPQISSVTADMVTPGIINYRIMVKKDGGDTYTFPGGFKGNPFAWDEYRNESWQTYVATPQSPLELFNATSDRTKIILYNPDWKANTVEYITDDKPNQLVLKATMNKPSTDNSWDGNSFSAIKFQEEKLSLSPSLN